MKKLFFLSFIFYLLSFDFAYAQRGLEFLGIGEKTPPGEIFEKIFFFGLGLVGLAALIVLVFGGMMYLTAGDSADQTKRARGYMSNAVFGLVLAFLSWLILFTINPDIVQVLDLNLKDITLKPDPIFRGVTSITGTAGPEVKQGISTCEAAGNIPITIITGFAGSVDNPLKGADGKELQGFGCIESAAFSNQKIQRASDENICKSKGGQRVITSKGSICSVSIR
jgi:hypothetical protein